MPSKLTERQQTGYHLESLIPTRAGIDDPLILLLPVEPLHDSSVQRFMSDPTTMSFLQFMAKPQGYSLDDVRERRESREQRNRDKEVLDFVIAIKRSQIPLHIVDQVSDGEFHEPTEVELDGQTTIRVDEPYVVAGICGMQHIDSYNRIGEAGIILDHRYWRTGISTSALYYTLRYGFETLKLHRIGVQTTEQNKGMRGWMERVVGVHVESIRKDALYLGEGEYVDSWEYAMFDYQWHGRIAKSIRKRLRMLE